MSVCLNVLGVFRDFGAGKMVRGYLGRKDKSDLVLGNLFLSSFSTPFINYYDLLWITFSFLVFLLS